MLSSKGKVCSNKDFILTKLQELLSNLQTFESEGSAKVVLRESQADAAKSSWLDAEGQYSVEKAALDQDDANLAADLKKVSTLQDLVGLNKVRLAKVKANNTEELSEIDDEEAIIKELMGYISDLSASSPSPVGPRPAPTKPDARSRKRSS
jgi:hypothetical protein